MSRDHHRTGHAQFVATCECGKRGYTDRKTARRAAHEKHPSEALNVYRCPTSGFWHCGHLPPVVKTGAHPRDILR